MHGGYSVARAHREDEDDDRRSAERLAHLQRAERKRACRTALDYPHGVSALQACLQYSAVPLEYLA